MEFQPRFLFFREEEEEEITRNLVNKWINKARNIKNLQEISKYGLKEKHIMLIHILKIMDENNILLFISKLTSFILKWRNMYNESESNSLTKIIDFFFSTDFLSFHIIFLLEICIAL